MTTATLLDGTVVDTDDERWRHQCEAAAIAALPTTVERRTWLETIERKRGKADADRLRATILLLWERKKHG